LAALIVEKGNITGDAKSDIFTAVYIMFVGAIGAGVAVSQMPSISKAKKSAREVFGIIEEKSLIDVKSTCHMTSSTIKKGTIVFENVSFKYPSRNKFILKNFSLRIKGNESVALVGHSGSGKSTIAALLLRFYNKSLGKILVDGEEIQSYSVK
jgi:ABC-type multidrug transport system fused ATPase/permease subunit